MKRVISINKDTVLELCVRPREAADDEDTAGFAAGPDVFAGRQPIQQLPDWLKGYRLAVIPIPHVGPPVKTTVQDVQAFMSKQDDGAPVNDQDVEGYLMMQAGAFMFGVALGAGAAGLGYLGYDAAFGGEDVPAHKTPH